MINSKNISRNFSGAVVGSVGSVQFQIAPCSSLYLFSRSIGTLQCLVSVNYRILVYCTCHFQRSSLFICSFCLSLFASLLSFLPWQKGANVVTYWGWLAQFCCGEGGTLQTDIAGMCVWGCPQGMDHTGFAPTHRGVCFPGLHCSGSRALSKQALPFVHFPGPSHSGSREVHKGTDSVGHPFCALRSEQVRQPGTWLARCPRWAVRPITSLVPAARFPCCATGAPSQLCISSGEWSQAATSWQVSSVQDPR